MAVISNKALRVEISETGAEMQSIRDVASGYEYLWQGDAAYWNGRSPILFPITGGLWNGTCRIGGRELHLPKHGFVRRKPWQEVSASEESTTFQYLPTPDDLEAFPFPFRLRATYTLDGRHLRVAFDVENSGTEALHFQLGAHPALNLPHWKEENETDGYLDIGGDGRYVLRAGEQGCVGDEHYAFPHTSDELIPLSVGTFANEALIFPERQLRKAILLDRLRRPVAEVASPAPVWLFWSPQGKHSPFVCVEPWYGLCDSKGFEGDITSRTAMQSLAPGASWHGEYTLTLFPYSL